VTEPTNTPAAALANAEYYISLTLGSDLHPVRSTEYAALATAWATIAMARQAVEPSPRS
jgi:hypothetical protein